MIQSVNINNRTIGDDMPTYIIAEMSANHAGSKDRAIELIHAAKESGADCIKIQTYTPDTLTINCNNKYFNLTEGTWKGENLYSLYSKAFTPWEWQADLKSEADKIGIHFFSTPFDSTSVDFLEGIGIEFYKIASFELVDIPLIEYVASKGKPLIISTGLGTIGEIQEAIDAVKRQGNEQVILMKCSSAYPAIPSNMNLKTILNMKETFNVPVGLSDHSMGTVAAITAVALGANVIEKHFCISRRIDNPDSSFSMEPYEFRKMVSDIRSSERAVGTISYEATDEEKYSIELRKSIFIVDDIKKGEILTKNNIRVIRPGHGIKPKYYGDVLGQVALFDIDKGTPLTFDLIGKGD